MPEPTAEDKIKADDALHNAGIRCPKAVGIIAQALADERERCEKVADDVENEETRKMWDARHALDFPQSDIHDERAEGASIVAARIRALGQTTKEGE